jgi:hypothetical protein
MENLGRTLLAIVYLGTSSGCMVLDEVDKANAKMARSKKSAPAATTPTTAPVTSDKNAVLEQTKKWWKEASSLAPSGIDSSIVECRLDRGSQFMSKDDCLTRGGNPRNASS